MAHYSGISPWSMFSIQCLTTLLTSFVQVGIMTFQLNGGIEDMCDLENRNHFICNGARTYFNASIIWGLIGPRRVFKGLYPGMKWCFLIGAVVPLPFWVWRKFGPMLAEKRGYNKKSWSGYIMAGGFLEYIDELLVATSLISPALGNVDSSVLPDFYMHCLFQFFIRQKFPRWWMKYAYLIPPSLSIGTSWAAFFNFWATQYKHIVSLDAWTTTVSYDNMDNTLTAVRLVVPDGEYFGPAPGTLP